MLFKLTTTDMKRLLSAAMLVCLAIGTAFASGPKKAGGIPPHRGVRPSQKQIETIQAVHPWIGKKTDGSKKLSQSSRLSSLASDRQGRHESPSHANTTGSTIQGWRTTDPYAEPAATRGWYELGLDGSQVLKWEYHDPDWVDDGWSDEPDFPFTAGFWRDGKVYGFHSEMVLYWLIWGHGSFTLDGQIDNYTQYGDNFEVTDFSTYVISCAYDAENDKVYAYTLNSDGTGYQLQTVNPETWEFNVLSSNVPIEDICIGFSYNPVDKNIYGLTPDARFVTLDTTSGTLNVIKKFNLPVNTQICGMTYSPLDKAFVIVIPESEPTSNLYIIDPANPELQWIATLENTPQYRILVTPDKLPSPETPLSVEIIAMNFTNASRSGSATIKLPTKTFGRTDLAANLTLAAYVDGKKYSEIAAHPGETIDVKFENIEEGMRRFSFSVISGELESAQADRSIYVGYDTPLAPGNIELKEGSLTWDVPQGTVNGGYLDMPNLTYNVYLNGEQINDSPITQCSYAFTMPEEVFRKYVAQVEAVNHGLASDRGFSNDIKYGKPFTLPFSMTPTEAEGELVKILTQRTPFQAWRWTYDNRNGSYFNCSTTDFEGPRSEWLYLPGIEVPQTYKLLEISFEMLADGYDENSENLAVGFASTQDPDNTTIVKEWKNLKNSEWTRMTVYCLPEAGTSYIAFLTETSEKGYYLNIRNIKMKISDRPVSTPAAPTGLKAEALPQGVLKAKVTFTMPMLDAAGAQLQDNTLTATVRTDAETKTISGAPGSELNVEIATVAGINEISVTASNTNEGLEATTSVFTGLDVPNPISAFIAGHTPDFKGIHIEWEDPTTGANGGYVDPTKVTYALCLFNEENYKWEIVQELGDVNSYDTMFDVPQGIALAEVGILTQNEKGNCGTILTVSGTVGTPYTLPMEEIFSESWTEKYHGAISSRPDDSYIGEWGYVSEAYPYWIVECSPFGPGAYCFTGNDGKKARLTLPAFSTERKSNVGIEIPLYAVSGKGEIRLYAKAYGIEPELIGTYSGTDQPEWTRKRFVLPSKFDNQKWVEIIIDGKTVGSEESTLAFAQYKIHKFVSDDIAISQIDAPKFPIVGETYEITARIENAGLATAASPEIELLITKEDKTLTTLTMTRADGTGNLKEFGDAAYKASWTPGAENMGETGLEVHIVGSDMNPDNDTMTMTVSVARGNSPVVTDLTATADETGVTLQWTEPTVKTGHEGFESFCPFSYGEKIGDFRTACLDGEETNYFANFSFPYQQESKAWQVIGEKEITEIINAAEIRNDFMTAYEGNNFIAAFSPFALYVGSNLQADRWIISPEVKGGSDFSFYMSSGTSGYLEYVEVLCSNGCNEPADFTTIEDLTLLTPGWKKYTYTLPEDAKYFAIRYKGNTSESFFTLLDDISYVPAENSPVIEGYDIYRDGYLLAENMKAALVEGTSTYLDVFSPELTTRYNIKPVIKRNGVTTRGMDSNTAYVSLTGIDEVETDADADAEYYSLQGFRVINPDKGIYIKRKGYKAVKVIIR